MKKSDVQDPQMQVYKIFSKHYENASKRACCVQNQIKQLQLDNINYTCLIHQLQIINKKNICFIQITSYILIQKMKWSYNSGELENTLLFSQGGMSKHLALCFSVFDDFSYTTTITKSYINIQIDSYLQQKLWDR
ncbi:hypothetical protein pb186bvf_005889 [Paramecium bursaria]